MLNECDIVSVRLFRADKKPGRLVRSTCRSRIRKSDGKTISEAEVFSNEMPIKAIITFVGKDDKYEEAVLSSFIYGKLNPLLKREGESIEVDILTLKDVVEDFYSLDGEYVKRLLLKERKVDEKELQAKRNVVSRIVEQYGNIPIETFYSQEFQIKFLEDLRKNGRVGKRKEFSQYKEKELSNKTVRNILTILATPFTFAIERGAIDRNPFKEMSTLLPDNTGENTYASFTTDIVKKMFLSIDVWIDPINYAMLVFLAFSGLRIDEAIALRREDIDLEKRIIYVKTSYKGGEHTETKTYSERWVPLPDILVFILTPLLEKPGYIFSASGRKPYTRIKYSRALTDALIYIGISKKEQQTVGYVLHSFRHWYVSSCASKGISDINISLITGHDTKKVSTMNKRYTTQLIEAFPGLVRRVDSFLPPATISAMKIIYNNLWSCTSLRELISFERNGKKK